MSSAMFLADHTEDWAFFPIDASTFSTANDWLFAFISWTSVAFFIPIAFFLFYFAWKYKKPKGGKAESNVSHNTPLEVAWSIFPSFFLVGMFVIGARHYLDQRMVPEGAFEVGVKAYKWGWGFDYGKGVINPELHLLVGEPAKMSMRSSDVIHSLYIPAFRAKKDIVPGRYNYMWFQPTIPSEQISDEGLLEIKYQLARRKLIAELDADDVAGREAVMAMDNSELDPDSGDWDQDAYDEFQVTKDGYRFYDLYCTEYCGTNHSEMQAMVVVHKTQEDLDAWITKYASRPDGVSLAEYGETLYNNRGCASCHSVDGSARVGPTFLNLYASEHGLVGGETVKVDPNYIRESILYPKAKIVEGYPAVMPSYKGQLSDDDINSIIEYLKTISDKTPPEELSEESAGEDAEPAKAA